MTLLFPSRCSEVQSNVILGKYGAQSAQYRLVSITLDNNLHTIVLTSAYGGVLIMSDAVEGVGYGGGFALVVVLFILLIIVGTSYVGKGY